jgi:hypothetical protein
MITVYKYIIDPYSSEIELPIGAEILSVAFQRDTCCVWAKVDTEAETEKRNFEVFGTGHEIPRNMGIDYEFVGTAHMDNGLVFHAFERLGL